MQSQESTPDTSSSLINTNLDSSRETVDLSIYYLDLIECPLDPVHKVRRHRLPNHLLKCRKNFPTKQKCPFGHFFYLEQNEMANHLQNCPYKPRIVQAEEMQPQNMENEYNREQNIKYNYDVNNFTTEEPMWD
ncbi:gametocyte-specific factor 1-like [Daktulosphaira vitifoliae]|uniref:gametocyte-specific factor 1-like n=1 Tax=Daktulosphaira vitifoliae TaxID=58002 RepID=UPI0021AA09A1|nr:gametocyte-specific factor 1-like [Daktulosphaira vitifoliae]XP_050539384.1 gametocyte-specific factor 1-like [Daktulosphaira vitifoliae]XP_050539385.1 gametocyte-specific factor 1-like [Daktulosphaira vitifoliae]XP_050539386.1 gametocyte-specific factor 1-like [Daktulosphaira vitifoliae]XP_050539387.1 gametocyte-specific factor 1-like [Daktulosphaira vitifoliae]